jgi:redox-sensitive bicupin YhaK (pirin superfamily)
VLEGTLYHEDTTGGKGTIEVGELQRMFSGDYIEHMEMNYTDSPARVIQIWFVADRQHQGLPPHYQQLGRAQLPMQQSGDATIMELIGAESPIDQHMTGRLTATHIPAGGQSQLVAPQPDEDLFLYVTDGAGSAVNGSSQALGQYDVILARPNVEAVALQAAADSDLDFLSFYLPRFLGE